MIPDRYSWLKLKRAIANPYVFVDEIERLSVLAWHQTVVKPVFRRYYGEGIDVMGEDWDNLIILDACRSDIFRQYHFLRGEFKQSISKGATSSEYIKSNFDGRELHDTILVTANPHYEIVGSDTFFYMSKTYDKHRNDYSGRKPQDLVDAAVAANDKYPEKRIVIHFMQPHTPYLGERADELRSRTKEDYGVNFSQIDQYRGKEINEENDIYSLRHAAQRGFISDSELLGVYIENFYIGLRHAVKLIDKIGGRSVITSDHGELLGDSLGFYSIGTNWGKMGGTYPPELRIVPWHIVEGKRRQVLSGTPVEQEGVDQRSVSESLKALGYLDDAEQKRKYHRLNIQVDQVISQGKYILQPPVFVLLGIFDKGDREAELRLHNSQITGQQFQDIVVKFDEILLVA